MLTLTEKRVEKGWSKWAGAGLLIEAMVARGYRLEFRAFKGCPFEARFSSELVHNFWQGADGKSESGPEAIALAARAALESEEG